MHAGTGHDQVSDPGKAGKGFQLSAHGHAKPADLRHAPGNEGCLGVVTVAKSVCDSRCQGDDIFQCPANLNSQDIRADVNPKYRAHEKILDLLRSFACSCPGHTGGRKPPAHLFCMARSGKNGHIGAGKLFLQNIRQCHEGCLLNALGHIDHQLSFFQERLHLPGSLPHIDGRNRHHQKVFLLHGTFQVRGKFHIVRKHQIRKRL